MKVLVHLNHGTNKSYLINFGDRASKGVIKVVLQLSEEEAAQTIYNYAHIVEEAQVTEVLPAKKSKASIDADFVVGHQGYISERLA